MSCGEEREVLARWNNGQWPTCAAPLPQASHHAEFQAWFTSSDQNTAHRTMKNASKYTITISISIDNNSTHVRSQNLTYGLIRCFASEEWKLVKAIPVIPRRLKPICVCTTNHLYLVIKLNKYPLPRYHISPGAIHDYFPLIPAQDVTTLDSSFSGTGEETFDERKHQSGGDFSLK